MIELKRERPLTYGILNGDFDRQISYTAKYMGEEPNYYGASLLHIDYTAIFTSNTDSASKIILKSHSEHRVHHTNAQYFSSGDIAICVSQCSHALKYCVQKTGLVLDGSYDISEPLPPQNGE